MSKSSPVKISSQSLQKSANLLPAVHKSGLPMMPEMHDVRALPVPAKQEGHLQLPRQKQQMLFAFSLFLLIGLLILAGQMISKPRMVAASELDQDHKACYAGENGEQVCGARTSHK